MSLSVNVGQPRQIGVRRGRPLMSGIVKEPVDGRVRATGVNLEGDGQADRKVHGGPDKAVYSYAAEDIAWWAEALGRPELGPGWFGENLTLEGVDVTRRRRRRALADRRGGVRGLPAPPALLQARRALRRSQDAQALRPRLAPRRVPADRRGGHGRAPGDEVEVLHRPDHGVTVQLVADAFLLDPSLQPEAAKAPELAASLADELRPAA